MLLKADVLRVVYGNRHTEVSLRAYSSSNKSQRERNWSFLPNLSSCLQNFIREKVKTETRGHKVVAQSLNLTIKLYFCLCLLALTVI